MALYIKLCLTTSNTNGRLCNNFGELIVPYNVEKITADMKHFSVDTVRVALEMYKKLGLIYEDSDGVLTIANHSLLVGSESATKEATKKREYRQRLKERETAFIETTKGTTKGTLEGTNCPTEIRDKRLEIRDKRLEIRDKKDNTDYSSVVDLYNQLCPSYPRLKSLSEARKKAIKARLKQYTLEDFETLFTKAEASKFLKGGNDRNWSATFDWLIKDSNMAKVLDGNYDNTEAAPKPKANNNTPNINRKDADWDAMEKRLFGL